MLKPVKAGNSISFTVSVKNNLSVYAIVSIDTLKMGANVAPWSKVDKRNDTIASNQTKTFKVTLTIPAGTVSYNYDFQLSLKAIDKNGVNRDYNYRILSIIIDNSIPDNPTFSISPASKSIRIYDWNSFDAISDGYTSLNINTGKYGIEKYRISLYQNTTLIDSITYLALSYTAKSFFSLSSNTNYNATVTAIDMAGNISTTEIPVLTAPAAPVLSSPSKTYCTIDLQWTAPAGAVQYELYNSTESPAVLLATTNSNSYSVLNLSVGKPYKFYVKAINSYGTKSDESSVFNVSTLDIPTPQFLAGTLNMCSSDKNIEVNSIIGANNYVWEVINPLTINGALTFTSPTPSVPVHTSVLISNGIIKVYANLTCGIQSNTATGNVRLGKPVINSNTPLAYYNGTTFNEICCGQTYITNMQIQNADNVLWTRTYANPVNTSWYQTGGINLSLYFFAVGQKTVFNIAASNTCGSQSYDFAFKGINCGDPCNPAYVISPNPASNSVIITPDIPAPCDQTMAMATATEGQVTIYDKQGSVKKQKKYKYNSQIEIDVQDLTNGFYIAEIFDGKTVVKKSFIVQH